MESRTRKRRCFRQAFYLWIIYFWTRTLSLHGEEELWVPALRKKKRVSSYRCTDCDVSLRNTRSLLRHLDEKHGIHVWYERGLTKKHVFFDGILKDILTEERRTKKEWIPLSKRPHELRRSNEDEDQP